MNTKLLGDFWEHFKKPKTLIAVSAAVIVTVVICLIIIFSVCMKQESFLTNLNGLWVSNENFLDESNLNAMMIYIKDSSDGAEKIGYLNIVDSDDNLISNQFVKIKLPTENSIKFNSFIKSLSPVSNLDIPINIEFGENKTFPEDVSMIFSPQNGTLIFYYGDTIHAWFVKDHSIE